MLAIEKGRPVPEAPTHDTRDPFDNSEDQSTDKSLDDPSPGRDGYRAPLWFTVVLGFVAVLALAIAVVSFRSTQQLDEEWSAFRAEITASGEQAAGALIATSSGLSLLADQPLVFNAKVDQEVPIVASIPFKREIIVPINTTIPINKVIETTITIAGPFGWDVPVDVTVPIDLEVPVNLSVPISIDEVIEVDTTTHLELTIPVELDLEETGLASLVRLISNNLSAIAESMPTAG